jgi:hypothetical protein
MTKNEIIAAVAYANAPEGVCLAETKHQGIGVTKVVSKECSPEDNLIMGWCGFMEKTFLMSTRDLPEEPSAELFTRLNRTLVDCKTATQNSMIHQASAKEIKKAAAELPKSFDPKIEKLSEIAKQLNIKYEQ